MKNKNLEEQKDSEAMIETYPRYADEKTTEANKEFQIQIQRQRLIRIPKMLIKQGQKQMKMMKKFQIEIQRQGLTPSPEMLMKQ